MNYKLNDQEYNKHSLFISTIIRKPGLNVIQLFSCLNQLSMKSTLLINVQMPATVSILTFISWVITTSLIYEWIPFMLSSVEHEKSF